MLAFIQFLTTMLGWNKNWRLHSDWPYLWRNCRRRWRCRS